MLLALPDNPFLGTIVWCRYGVRAHRRSFGRSAVAPKALAVCGLSGRLHTNDLPARFATDFCTKYISVSETSEVATTM
jgi:hypothetical protein